MSILTVACFATSFVIVDGPLLQRASTVIPATVTSNVTLNLHLPPEAPYGLSGVYQNHELMYTKAGFIACKDLTDDVPIKFGALNCNGTVSECCTPQQRYIG